MHHHEGTSVWVSIKRNVFGNTWYGPAQELCLFSHNSLRDTWGVSLRVSYGVRLHQNSCRIGMSWHNPYGRILIFLYVRCGMKNFLPKLILSWSCNLVKLAVNSFNILLHTYQAAPYRIRIRIEMLEPAFQVVHPLPSHFSGGPSICLLSVRTPQSLNWGFSLVGGISKFPRLGNLLNLSNLEEGNLSVWRPQWVFSVRECTNPLHNNSHNFLLTFYLSTWTRPKNHTAG